MGIFTRRDFRYGAGLVEYTLSLGEVLQIAMSCPMSILGGGCPADYFSDELESVRFTNDHPRLRLLVPLTDVQLDEMSPSEMRRLRKDIYL